MYNKTAIFVDPSEQFRNKDGVCDIETLKRTFKMFGILNFRLVLSKGFI